MKTIKIIVTTILFSALTLTSCNKDKDSTETMEVRMTDAPGDYAKLDVEITKVEAYNNEGWVTLKNESQIVSVLDLTNGQEVDLVSKTTVKSGVYTKLRLTFGNNNKIWVNTEASLGGTIVNTEFDLTMSSASKQYEVEINQNTSGETETSILLDFNVAESISGSALTSFTLNPQITVIKDEKTGINGQVVGSQNTAILIEGNGNTYSGYADSEGSFLIRGMVEGTYKVTLMPTEDDLPDTVIEAVVITNGEIKSMGTVTMES